MQAIETADGGANCEPSTLLGQTPPRASILSERKYTIPKAAKILGISETKLRAFIRKGLIPAVLIDRKYLLLERDLIAFLESRYGTIKSTRPRVSRGRSVPKWVRESNLLKRSA